MLNRREKTLSHIAFSVIICGLALNFIIVPLLSKHSRLTREITLSETSLKKYVQLSGQNNNVKDKYNEFLFGISSTGQKQNVAIEMLANLEQMANSANIRIVDVRPQSSQSSPASESTLIELKTEGSLDGYVKFVYSIESPLSLLRIKNIQLTAKPGSQLLDGNLSIYGFSWVESGQ